MTRSASDAAEASVITASMEKTEPVCVHHLAADEEVLGRDDGVRPFQGSSGRREVIALATLTDDRPFHETLDSLIEFVTREESPDVPSGCLFAKMRNFRRRLGPITGEHVDQLRADAITAYTAWLRRCADNGDIELPASLETTATYVDAQLTSMLTRISAGEDPDTEGIHALVPDIRH